MKRFIVAIVAGASIAGHVPFPGPVLAQGVRYSISPHGSAMLTVAGQVRLRGESWSHFGAGEPAGADLADAFGLARVMLRTGLNLRDRVELGLELKSSLASHRTLPGRVRTADEDRFDVQQAFLGVAIPAGRGTLAARAGRFELGFGRERLVGPVDWSNTRRAFQGLTVRAAGPRGDVTGFLVRPVAVRRRTPNIADSTRRFYGVIATRTAGPRRAELYWLRNETGTAVFNGTTGYERRHTFGARVVRGPAAGRFDAELEAAWQTGSVGGGSVGAWLATAVLGRSFGGPGAVRAYVAVDAASGDSGGTDADVGTFNQLFPTGHAHLGYVDLHGRQNVIALSAGASARPLANTTLLLDAFVFRRANAGDALYGSDGSVVRAPGTSRALGVGRELDLTLRRTLLGGRLTAQAGASMYFAGPFLEQTGNADDISWMYAQLTAAF